MDGEKGLPMNVLLVSTSEKSGGGAIAARRLMDALNKNGVKAKMMVRDAATQQKENSRTIVRVGNKIPKLLERLAILPHVGFSRKRLWQVDIANAGIDITHTREFHDADIIHLHWVCQGMLSLDTIRRILTSGKRIVWTLHDEWPYLGVCHYRGNCTEEECRHCPLMSGNTPYYIYTRKHAMYSQAPLTFIGCSQWIADRAQHALPSARVRHINNCIPAALFHPTDMQQARHALSLPQDRRLLLFCSQKVTDERKGMVYLTEALRQSRLPMESLHLVIVGKDSEQIPVAEGIGITRLGTIGEQEMSQVYNAVDAFLTPSLQDNLPNTIAEAMSCGTPCVGFDVGGIPEMIDHKANGYVARYRDAADFAEGIRYVLSHDLRDAAYGKAAQAYNETIVAQQYIDIYQT